MQKISVIIPTYKPGDYLAECLKTIQCQTLDKGMFEVVIVLNGCDEPWHSQVKGLIKDFLSDLDVRLIQTDTPGVSNARNIGIDNAKGEYITFIDDDDYISPSYLEELLKCSTSDCVGLTDCIYIDDMSGDTIADNPHHIRFNRNISHSEPSLFQSRVFFNGPVMKLIHRDIIGLRRFDKRFKNGEDSLFMFLISDRIKTLQYTSSNAIYYRRVRANSATTIHRSKWVILSNCSRLMLQYAKYFLNNPVHYNLPFFLSRELATIKNFLLS